MTGVDTDLATLREELTRFLVERRGKYPQRDSLDALARLEAELSRLREQRDEHAYYRKVQQTFGEEQFARAEAAEARCARLQQALDRAVYLAQHLHAMIPQSVWRDSGGDDMQGHYEGDYHAEKVAEELKALAGQPTAAEGPDTPADCEHDYVFEQGSLSLYRCDKCGQESYDGVFPRVGNYPLPAGNPEEGRPVYKPADPEGPCRCEHCSAPAKYEGYCLECLGRCDR